MTLRFRIALLIGLAAAAIVLTWLLPPVHQDPAYHQFADQQIVFGIPNFWNVISNGAFLLVALWGLVALRNSGAFAEAWERSAYMVLLVALGLVAFDSGYYHLHPSDATLFWDRLPMVIVFMALLAITVGERLHPRAGQLLLAPLLLIGVASLVDWKATGDLRAYGLVQFYPLLALPLMLIQFPPRYTGTSGVWAMVALYAIAKTLELADYAIWNVAAPISGHPWKHVAGAAAMFCYVETVRHRAPIESFENMKACYHASTSRS